MNSFVFARYYYFASEDDEAIKGIWNHLAKACRLETGIAQESQTTLSLIEPRALSVLNRCASDYLHLCILAFENYAVVEVLFSSRSPNVTKDWRNSLKFTEERMSEASKYFESALGNTSLLIGKGEPTQFLEQAGTVFPAEEISQTDLRSGTLYRFGGEEGTWQHRYGLLPDGETPGQTGLEEDFLIKDFAVLDLSFLKLEHEAKFFQEQQATLTKERKEIDKEVGSILHKEVVLPKAGPDEIETLESEIGALSRLYGVLASSRTTVKQAHGTLDQDLRKAGRLVEDLLAPGAGEKDLLIRYLPFYKRFLTSLAFEDELFRQSLDNAKAAIDVVQTRVGLLRSGESLLLQRQTKGILDQNILLQEEGISLQVAASFIEFVVVFFYTLEAWKALAEERIEVVPVFWQFGLVFAFALSVVLCTHFAAKALRQKKKVSWKLLLVILSALALVGAMAAVTVLY